MDLWEEVDAGCGVWQIARDMYGSVCLCVSNRSRVAVVVTIDTSACINCIVMGSGLAQVPVAAAASPNTSPQRNMPSSDGRGGPVAANIGIAGIRAQQSPSSSGEVVRAIVSPSRTVVVCVFSPQEDLLPMRIHYTTKVVERSEATRVRSIPRLALLPHSSSGSSPSAFAATDAFDGTLVEATQQSKSVQTWLASRK